MKNLFILICAITFTLNAAVQYIQQGGHFGEFNDATIRHIKKGVKIVILGHTPAYGTT